MKQKMEKMQVLNDGADEEDFNELLKILRSFGEVEVLYDPSNPKDKDVAADEVIERYDNFKKKVKMGTNTLNGIDDGKIGENGPNTKGCILDTAKGTGKRRRRSRLNEANTTISTAA